MLYNDLDLSYLNEETLSIFLDEINEDPILRHDLFLAMNYSYKKMNPEDRFSKSLLYAMHKHFLQAKAILLLMKHRKDLFKIESSEFNSIKSTLTNLIFTINPILEKQIQNIKDFRNEDFLYYFFEGYNLELNVDECFIEVIAKLKDEGVDLSEF